MDLFIFIVKKLTCHFSCTLKYSTKEMDPYQDYEEVDIDAEPEEESFFDNLVNGKLLNFSCL